MTRDVSFGFCVPTFAGAPDDDDGYPGHVDDPCYEELDWATTRESILAADELGFDSVWAPDHMLIGRDHAEYECWTLLSTVAGLTDDVRIGSLVLCNDFRNPALVAKMAATLDVVSDGRLELGLGAGSNPADYHAYGWEHRDAFERLMRLDEAIRVMKEMWTSEAPSFSGEHYEIDDAYCEPKPVQDPHPPIVVGGGGEAVTLKLAARHADVWNGLTSHGHVETLAHKIDVIEDHCATVGRDPDEIEYSWEGLVLVARDEERFERVADRLLDVVNARRDDGDEATLADLREQFPMGTPEEVAASIEERVDVGVTTFMFYFLDYPDRRGMELFADEVAPGL